MTAMQVHVARSDLADLPVDAVVNPSNSYGLMVSGVARALRVRGGPRIEEAARSSAPIAVGAAVVTTGGNLYAKYVIHAPTMEEPGMKIGVENVRRATRAALIAASRHNFQSLGLPGMGTGVGGVALDEAARAMVDELRVHKQPFPETIYLVAVTDALLEAFLTALRNATTVG